MKRMLIKVVLVLLVVYISGELSLKYSEFSALTLRSNLLIVLLFRFVPGFLCGLIIGYESILQFFKIKPSRLDARFILISILLVGLVASPYLFYAYPFVISSSVFRVLDTMMSYTFSLMVSLLAGYCLTQSFSFKK